VKRLWRVLWRSVLVLRRSASVGVGRRRSSSVVEGGSTTGRRRLDDGELHRRVEGRGFVEGGSTTLS